jgi:ribosomal protein L40E
VYLKDIAGNGATQTWTFSIQLPNYTNWIIAGVIGVAIVVLVIALLKRKPKAASQVVSPAIPSQTATTSSEAPKTSVIHCTNCGTENNSGATYCIKCGKPILRPE